MLLVFAFGHAERPLMAGLTVRLHLVSTSLAWSLPRISGDEFTVQFNCLSKIVQVRSEA